MIIKDYEHEYVLKRIRKKIVGIDVTSKMRKMLSKKEKSLQVTLGNVFIDETKIEHYYTKLNKLNKDYLKKRMTERIFCDEKFSLNTFKTEINSDLSVENQLKKPSI